VAAGRSLADEFERRGAGSSETPRSVLIDLTHGTLRRYGRVQAIVQELSRRGRPDTLVESLLWCSLYALESGRYTEYTVVDQAVRACTLLERWSAKGYVNGLLRRFIRERSALESRLRADPQARFQHPQWWIEALRIAYPGQWEAVLAAGNSHPPMCLRVNRRRTSAAEYQALLALAGQASRQVGEEALLLERPLPVDRLPRFDAGDVSVQDLGAQRAAHCLDLAAGQRVLDACAAPGGKAAHILELADVELTALDADAARSGRIKRTFERLGLIATIRTADCTRLAEWWDGVPFERILADVPCSASGIARRHPDLKWLRRAADVAAFAERQGAILDTLWQALAAGGKLLYVTCSVFPQENDAVIEAFVARAPGALRLALPDDSPAQRLPDAEHDGFYHALIQKPA
ncbi:MAG: 16S rRNA (cytosine(967)-C(5))-methyltransferase RsmB, partial [Pseudomonadota bacterium]|nr:16S rRNA (cytosine(967)-C(5))-methyltransferase RsmB [Pseudomonadota bacterium]